MSTTPPRLLFAAIGLLAIGAQLIWETLHGGIVSHHLLQRADMPAMSNAWGLLIVPALAAWTAGRLPRRPYVAGDWLPLALGFGLPFLLGAALSVAFVFGAMAVVQAIFFSMLVLAVLLPAYRRECLLGLVLGECLVFGPVLPLLFGAIFATVSWLLQRSARWVWRTVRPA